MTVTATRAPARAERKRVHETEERRRATGARDRNELILLGGSMLGALCLTTLLVTRVMTDPGPVGFAVLAYLLFVGLYATAVSLTETAIHIRDRVMAVLVHGFALVALAALVYVVVFTFLRGSEALGHLNFFFNDMSLAGPLDPLTVGGIVHAAAGTLIEITIALTITVPLGVATAVFLSEFRGPFPRLVRTLSEAMTALPSIVAGLFILASAILTLGVQRSGFAAGLALSVMMLPIIIRASDVVLRLVPGSLREASLAMGAGQWRTVWHVVLPTARSGLTTAVLLGTARGIGETSPVLITAGFGSVVNVNPTSGPMVSLPLAAFVFSGFPEKTMVARGFGAAATLLIIVFVLFALARVFGGKPAGELSAGARRRRAQESARDVARWAGRGNARAAAEVHRG